MFFIIFCLSFTILVPFYYSSFCCPQFYLCCSHPPFSLHSSSFVFFTVTLRSSTSDCTGPNGCRFRRAATRLKISLQESKSFKAGIAFTGALGLQGILLSRALFPFLSICFSTSHIFRCSCVMLGLKLQVQSVHLKVNKTILRRFVTHQSAHMYIQQQNIITPDN